MSRLQEAGDGRVARTTRLALPLSFHRVPGLEKGTCSVVPPSSVANGVDLPITRSSANQAAAERERNGRKRRLSQAASSL
jgi:hypothetical protein